jgi:hypothetical protein
VYLLELLVRVESLCVFVGAVSASFELMCICWRCYCDSEFMCVILIAVSASSEFICICRRC